MSGSSIKLLLVGCMAAIILYLWYSIPERGHSEIESRIMMPKAPSKVVIVDDHRGALGSHRVLTSPFRASASGLITIAVVDRTDGSPVPVGVVYVVDSLNKSIRDARNYRIALTGTTEVAPGNYYGVDSHGYVPRIIRHSDASIVVHDGQQKIVVEMARSGVVRGRLMCRTKPVPGVVVAVGPYTIGDGDVQPMGRLGKISTAITDVSGVFEVTNLPLGASVYVSVQSVDYCISGLPRNIIVSDAPSAIEINMHPLYVAVLAVDGLPRHSGPAYTMHTHIVPDWLRRIEDISPRAIFCNGEHPLLIERAVRSALSRVKGSEEMNHSYELFIGDNDIRDNIPRLGGWYIAFGSRVGRFDNMAVDALTVTRPSIIDHTHVNVADAGPLLARWGHLVRLRFVDSKRKEVGGVPPFTAVSAKHGVVASKSVSCDTVENCASVCSIVIPSGPLTLIPNLSSGWIDIPWSFVRRELSIAGPSTIDVVMDEPMSVIRVTATEDWGESLVRGFCVRSDGCSVSSLVNQSSVYVPVRGTGPVDIEVSRVVGTRNLIMRKQVTGLAPGNVTHVFADFTDAIGGNYFRD